MIYSNQIDLKVKIMNPPEKSPHSFIPVSRHFRGNAPVTLRLRNYQELSDLFHCHEFSELVLVLSGSGIHVTQERETPIYPGDVFLIQPRRMHGYRELRQLHIANFLFVQQRFTRELEQLKSLRGYYHLFEEATPVRNNSSSRTLNEREFSGARELMARMQQEQQGKSPGWELQFRLLFVELLLLICRSFSRSQKECEESSLPVERTLRYLDEHYAEPVTLHLLARHCGCSVPTLTRQFRLRTGDSPIGYLNRLRLDKAARLLSGTTLPVGEIAGKTGFGSSSYLARCFRTRYQLSPHAWRKKYRTQES